MSVYVDPPMDAGREPAGYIGRTRSRPLWAHMIADTEEELHAMAVAIRLRRAWCQPARRGRPPHYDLVPSKRRLAIQKGAIALDRRAFVARLREGRG